MRIVNVTAMQAVEEAECCGKCLWFRTPKCRYSKRSIDRQAIQYQDHPCEDGLICLFFGSDSVLKMGRQQYSFPLRFLTARTTKNQLMRKFELDSTEVEEIVIAIKQRYQWKKSHKPKPKPKPQPKEDPEIVESAQKLLKDPDILNKFMAHAGKWIVPMKPQEK